MTRKTLTVVAWGIGALSIGLVAAGLQARTGQSHDAAAPVVRHVTDRKTGLDIRVTQAGTELTVEVADKTIAIKKALNLGRSVTTLTSGREQLVIAVDGPALFVTDHGKTVNILDPSGDGREDILKAVETSPIVTKARALLARMDLDTTTVTGNSLRLTDVMLAALTGDSPSVARYREHAPIVKAERRLPIAYQKGDDPESCWDKYSSWAIKIADEFVDCKAPLHWYQLTAAWACDTIYAAEAEGAWAWFISCNGGMHLNGE
jgi:hypothetical protein